MQSSHREDDSITDLNIAPLVDVILVLLIIFMATAPLIQRRTLSVNVPKVAQSEPKATATTNITIDENRQIFLVDQQIEKADLRYQLAIMQKADPLLHIAILADEKLPYGEVVDLLDLVRGTGIKKVALEVGSKRAQE